MKKVLPAGTALLLAIAAPADAVRITYTLEAEVTGTFAGNPFSGVAATFVGIGDTDDIVAMGGFDAINLSSIAALFDGRTYTISTPATFFTTGRVTGIYFGGSVDAMSAFAFDIIGYEGVSNRRRAAVDLNFPSNDPGENATFDTGIGTAIVTRATRGTFSASVAPVPEPVTWGLLVLGFGLIGVVMRRRRSIPVRQG